MTTPLRDALERVARQLLQVAAPAIATILSSPTVSDATTTLVALLSVAIVTFAKVLAGLKAGPGAPLWLVLVDRAGSAFGSLLISLGITDWAGLVALDWDKALTAAVSAAIIAAISYFTVPPANPPTPVEPAGPAGSTGDYDPADVEDDLGYGTIPQDGQR